MGPQLPGLSSRSPANKVHCNCIASCNHRISVPHAHRLHGHVSTDTAQLAHALLLPCPSTGSQLSTSRCSTVLQLGSSRRSRHGWPQQAAAGAHHSGSSSTAEAQQCNSRQSSTSSSSAAPAEKENQQQAAQHSQGSNKGSKTNGNGAARSNSSRQRVVSCVLNEQLSGAAIMKQLKATRDWHELQQVVQQHSEQLNWKHSSALLTHLAQLTKDNDQLTQQHEVQRQQQQQQQQQEQPDGCARPHSNRSSIHGPAAQQMLASVMQVVDGHIEQYDARGLSNTIWALARLQHVAAAATSHQQQQIPSRQWLGRFCSRSQAVLQHFDMQQLSNTLWALVQLQHSIPHAWLQDWYAAVSSRLSSAACREGDGTVNSSSSSSSAAELQAIASVLWSITQLPLSSRPSPTWLDTALTAAAARLQASSSAGAGAHSSSPTGSCHVGTGQAVSNLLWSCAQLQHQLPLALLAACSSWLQGLAAAGQQGGSVQLSNQSLANSMWALAKLQQQQQQHAEHSSSDQERRESGSLCSTSSSDSDVRRRGNGRDTSSSGGNYSRTESSWSGSSSKQQIVSSCGVSLLQISSTRLKQLRGQHLSNVVWAAGVMQLSPPSGWVTHVQQQVAAGAAGFEDQQVANILWGLSQLVQPQQQQRQNSKGGRQRQQLLQAAAIEHLLEAQQVRLLNYSSQALSSSLLSVARLGIQVSEPLLQAWLKEIARRNFLSAAGGRAMTDSCCALALMRRNEAAAAAAGSSSVGSSVSVSLRGGFQQQGPDHAWLTGLCNASLSRLATFSGDELAGLGCAMASLRFRPPVPWLLAWHSALSGKAGSMSGAAAAKALKALQELPAGPQGGSKETAARQLVAALASSSGGGLDAQSIAVAAACIAACKGSKAGSSSSSSRSGDGDIGEQPALAQPPSSSRNSSTDAQRLLQHLLGSALPLQLGNCNSQQLVMVLSAAAAAKAVLPQGLLLAALQRLQHLAEQRQLDSRGSASAVAAVAKLKGSSSKSSRRGSLQGQQQQQQQGWASDAPLHMSEQQQQQQRQQHVHVPRTWISSMLKAFRVQSAGPVELSLMLWSLAVLEYNPGKRWLAAWLQSSQQCLPSFTPGQLASCGWALAVLNHVPSPTWQAAWLQGSGLQAAAAKPSEQALMLYAAAALGFPVERTWLQSFAMLSASGIRRWSVRDMSMGLWGLAQLGLRAVADAEVLEVLLGQMVATTAAGGIERLTPHQQLQLLQAAVLLRQPTTAEEAQTSRQKSKTQQQQQQQQQLFSKSAVRRLHWQAKTAADIATAAAATARAAVMQHQQLVQHNQQLVRQQLSSSSECTVAVAAAGAAAQGALTAWEVAAGNAAAAAAAVLTASTGRSPDAVGLPVDQSWLLLWCKGTLPQLHQWTPSVTAAALSAIAVMGGLAPPVSWQRQLLLHVQQCKLKQQEVGVIAHALDVLRSPLKDQWLSQVQVTYAPGSAAAAGKQQDQQKQQKHRRKVLRIYHMPWLKGMAAAALEHGTASHGRACYPQQLSGYELQQQRRQHRAVRLVTWWKRQQQLQRQRLLQWQWRSVAAVDAARSVWRSPAATAASSFSSTGSRYGSLSSFSGSASLSVSPAGSVDNGTGAMAPSAANPGSAAGAVAGPCLESRKLSNGLLAPRPVRYVQAQDSSSSSKIGSGDGASSREGDASAAAPATDAGAGVGSGVTAVPLTSALGECTSGTSGTQPSSGSSEGPASAGSNTGSSSSAAVGADAGVVQAVWSSFAAAGVPVASMGMPAAKASVAAGGAPELNGVLQRQLSWACQSE